MSLRRHAREWALQALYQADATNDWSLQAFKRYLEIYRSEQVEDFEDDESFRNPKIGEHALLLVQGVVENLDQIDRDIVSVSLNWSLGRMTRVDRNILRLGVYEIAKLTDVPANVAINEAIEIAKRYGSDDSPMFINGILDKIANAGREQDSQLEVAPRKVVANA